MAAGLYALQNSRALATSLPTVPWLVWALPVECVVFSALHVYAYFYIIKFYEPKHLEKSESAERKDPGPES